MVARPVWRYTRGLGGASHSSSQLGGETAGHNDARRTACLPGRDGTVGEEGAASMPYLECRDCGSPFDGAADDSLTRTCPECFGEIAVYSVKPRAPATDRQDESRRGPRRVILLSRRLGADPSAPAAARRSLEYLHGVPG